MSISIQSGSPFIGWTDDIRVAMHFARETDATMFWYLHPEPANIPQVVYVD